ncbi:hypothetical protein AAFH96_25880 [Polymorphospora sp. 2-325]|uniref:YopA central domain-containing protein n=1 Tax=Polymorphospora lycopeni TaxID=3140240 RepID=A0ABV5CWX0_9ACTN
MLTKESEGERDNVPLTPIYPFNQPGEAVDLYSGPIGGLYDSALEGTIRLAPFPSPGLRWEVDVPDADGYLMNSPRDLFDLTAGRMTGRGLVTSTSFGSAAGTLSSLEFESGDPMDRVLVHWMNLPDYSGNATLRYDTDGSRTWTSGRLALEVDGWGLTLDGRPDNSRLFKDDVGLARYVLTHVLELRRTDGASFDSDSAKRVIEALRLSLSFAAGRWVAPPLTVGFDARGGGAWQRWGSPICAPYERIGSPVISPVVSSDLEAFIKASVARLYDGDATNTTGFQMQLATQTSNLGFVENRIFSAFPAIENLSWETFVLGGLVPKKEFEDSKVWPTARRLRELLVRAQIPVDIDEKRLPVLYRFAVEKGVDGPDMVTWVRNRLIHPKNPHDGLYARESLVVEAWQQSREYICLLLLHAIGYTGGYLSAIPPYGWLGNPTLVPWTATDSPAS